MLYCIIYVSANLRFTCTWNLNTATVVIWCMFQTANFTVANNLTSLFSRSLVLLCFSIRILLHKMYSVRVWLLKKRELLFCLVFSPFFFFFFVSRTLEFIFYDTIIAFLYFIIPFSIEEYSATARSFYTPFFVIIYYCYSSAYFIATSQRNGIHWLALLCGAANASTQFCLCITSNHTHTRDQYNVVYSSLCGACDRWKMVVNSSFCRNRLTKEKHQTHTNTFAGLFISFACSRSSSMPAKIYQFCVCVVSVSGPKALMSMNGYSFGCELRACVLSAAA